MWEGYLMLAMAFAWPALGAAALGTGAYFARRYVRAVERRGGDAAELAELRRRLAELEEAAEGTRLEVERLEAGQEFTSRLLAERTPSAR